MQSNPIANVPVVSYPNEMNVSEINAALFRGHIDAPGVLPHLARLAAQPLQFNIDFGLTNLPKSPGILMIRGARQYGKSTWLQAQIRATIEHFGPGSAFYLNGDECSDVRDLHNAIAELIPSFAARAAVKRLFIDEITAVRGWETALKRLADAGELTDVLVVTTGSKATDLRRGAELLPGRKGRLERTSYLFTPIAFAEFDRVCGADLGADAVWTYLLSGGSPLALSELATHGRLPEFVIETVRDWIRGEVAASGRSRGSLMAVMDALCKRGGSALGQAKLAREAGLANNTIAAGYVELLADLTVLGISHPWDASRQIRVTRRPAKFPFINLLAAVAWHPARLRSVADWHALPTQSQGMWVDWLVAQELWRRAAIDGAEAPELLPHWSSKQHELDFVVTPKQLVEVKRGRTGPLDFGWFAKRFADAQLLVVGGDNFATEHVRGLDLRGFLLGDDARVNAVGANIV